jgi:ABC-type molybdate transport system substrate-binding protein
MGLTVLGSKKSEAVEFLQYLRSDEGKTVLKKHGFVVE